MKAEQEIRRYPTYDSDKVSLTSDRATRRDSFDFSENTGNIVNKKLKTHNAHRKHVLRLLKESSQQQVNNERLLTNGFVLSADAWS